MLRPIVFFDQSDPQNTNRDHEFLCGDHLLVCPVVEENTSIKNMYLPSGEWYDYWTNQLYVGGVEHTSNAPIDQIPLFVQRGAIIPKYPIQQYVGEKDITEVELSVYHSIAEVNSDFYEDGGDGYGYENGDYRMSKFTVSGSDTGLNISQQIEGTHNASFSTYRLNLIGLPFEVNSIIVDGQEVTTDKNGDVIVDANFEKISIQ